QGLQLDPDNQVRRGKSSQERVRQLDELGGIPVAEPAPAGTGVSKGFPYFLRGNSLRARRNFSESVLAYQKGVELEPDNVEARWILLMDQYALADAYKKAGNAASAKIHHARAEAAFELLAGELQKRAETSVEPKRF